MARSYSIYEAKARFSELLRIVKAGNDVVVLERGKPIARVTPITGHGSLATRLQLLRQNGLLSPRSPSKFPKGKKILGGLKRFLADR